MSEPNIESGQDLAEWMKRMNLTLIEAADLLGKSRVTLSKYAKGQQSLPAGVARLARLIEIARRGKPYY